MRKLEYLNPIDWSLHVIDGENEGVPDGWIKIPNKRYKFYYTNGQDFFWTCDKYNKYGELLWSRKMKEYLVERDGKYELVEAYHLDGGIEVPEGALCGFFSTNKLTRGKISFAKHVNNKVYIKDARDIDWDTTGWKNWKQFIDYGFDIVWQRNQSLNDRCAETEKVRQDNIDSILLERQSQYGCYEDVAKTTQDILKALRIGNYENMPAPHQEALHMIASKMARLVHGDANHLDSWVDIGGYSKLIVNLIEGGK